MNGTRRATFLAVIVAALVAGGILTRTGAQGQPAIDRGPRLATAAESRSTWYCAEGSSQPDGRATEEIEIGNVDTRPARAVVTVFAGSEVVPVSRPFTIPAGKVKRIPVSAVAAVPEPGVLVEVSGARTAVQHRIARGGDTAVGPCAREPATVTRFAAGTTGKGAELWLALFNPFPDDAIIDVRALTGSGVRTSGRLRGIVVPRFSRVSVPMHDALPRVELVGTEVTTRRGRVVAEQSLVLDGSDGRRGLALTLGGDVARRWRFPIGLTGSGRSERMLLANPTDRDVRTTVRFALDAAAAIEPERLIVPAATVVALDLARVPPDIPFSVVVASSGPIVAEMVGASSEPQASAVRGIASALGLTIGAKQWAVIPARGGAGSTDTIAVVSTDGRAHRVQLTRSNGGTRRVVARRTVPASGRVVFDLGRSTAKEDLALLLRSDGPVVVERESTGPGLTRSPAIRG